MATVVLPVSESSVQPCHPSMVAVQHLCEENKMHSHPHVQGEIVLFNETYDHHRYKIAYDSRFVQFCQISAMINAQRKEQKTTVQKCVDLGPAEYIVPQPNEPAHLLPRVIAFSIARTIAQRYNAVLTCPFWKRAAHDQLDMLDTMSRIMISAEIDDDTLRFLCAESMPKTEVGFASRCATRIYEDHIFPNMSKTIDSTNPYCSLIEGEDGMLRTLSMDEELVEAKMHKIPVVIMAKLPYCTIKNASTFPWDPIVIIGDTIFTCFDNDRMSVACINNAALARANFFGNNIIRKIFAFDYGGDRYAQHLTLF